MPCQAHIRSGSVAVRVQGREQQSSFLALEMRPLSNFCILSLSFFVFAASGQDLPPSYQRTEVASSQELVDALRDSDVGLIVLKDDILFDGKRWSPADTVFLSSGRNVTITSSGSPNLTAITGSELQGSTVLDFDQAWPVVELDTGASLMLQGLVVKGRKDNRAPEVRQYFDYWTQGLATWPVVHARVGSEMAVRNVLYHQVESDCSPAAVRARANTFFVVVGPGAVGVMPDQRTIYIQGTQELPLPVELINSGEFLGTMQLVNYGAAYACVEEEVSLTPGPSSGGGPQWWIWLVVGLAALLGLVSLVLAAGWWRAHKGRAWRAAGAAAPAAPQLRRGSNMGWGLPLADVKLEPSHSQQLGAESHSHDQHLQREGEHGAAGAVMKDEDAGRAAQAESSSYSIGETSTPGFGLTHGVGLASTLRIRFGELDQVDIGELIGRGGYGRVYRARWRGAPAAVKVIEHSHPASESSRQAPSSLAGSGSPASTAGTPWEGVLSTALSHPNIVTTYRVSTVRLQSTASPLRTTPASSQGVTLGLLLGDISFRAASPAGGQEGAPAAGKGTAAAAAKEVGSMTHGGQEEVQGSGGAGAAAVQGNVPPAGAQAGGKEDGEEPADSTAQRGGQLHAGGAVGGSEGNGEQGEDIGSREMMSELMMMVPSGQSQQAQQQRASRQEELALYETWLVIEYCDKGSLADAIRTRRFVSRRSGQPHLRAVLGCLQDVARGMLYLHSHNIVHGDLKAGNILLKSREDGGKGASCKVADFGLSRLLDPSQTQLLTKTFGTISCMPPEMMSAGQLTTATDVYSFGMLMWEMVAGQFAFADQTPAQIFFQVVTLGTRPQVPPEVHCPASYASLMQRCWASAPSDRPSFSEILLELQSVLHHCYKEALPSSV